MPLCLIHDDGDSIVWKTTVVSGALRILGDCCLVPVLCIVMCTWRAPTLLLALTREPARFTRQVLRGHVCQTGVLLLIDTCALCCFCLVFLSLVRVLPLIFAFLARPRRPTSPLAHLQSCVFSQAKELVWDLAALLALVAILP
jgi:hypothetical protein